MLLQCFQTRINPGPAEQGLINNYDSSCGIENLDLDQLASAYPDQHCLQTAIKHANYPACNRLDMTIAVDWDVRPQPSKRVNVNLCLAEHGFILILKHCRSRLAGF